MIKYPSTIGVEKINAHLMLEKVLIKTPMIKKKGKE